MTLQCNTCLNYFEAKRKDTLYCPACKKQRRSMQTMLSRKKRLPSTELGVGSGKAQCNLPGPTNKAWKTGVQAYRKLIDKQECAYCKATRNLLIHHKDEDRYNNQTSNLMVLCKSCHQKFHAKRGTDGRFVKLQTNTEITK